MINKFKYKQIKYLLMQETKPNFIEEMRRKLNNYHIEKLRRMQESQQNKEYFQQEIKAKDALMEFDQSHQQTEEPSGFEDITGWNSTRPVNVQENQVCSQRRSFGLKRNVICSVPSKTLGFEIDKKQRNPDMINYLKTLLTRLQSPVNTKRCLKTQNNKKVDENTKLKIIEAAQQIKKSRINMLTSKNQEKIPETKDFKQFKQTKEMKTDKAKFQIIDLNTENNPFTAQPSRAVSHYQKIKRKSINNQYEIDVARERDILQQLIRGGSASRSNYNSQRGHKSSQKFTLKNLLC